jgi:hypothetical protein
MTLYASENDVASGPGESSPIWAPTCPRLANRIRSASLNAVETIDRVSLHTDAGALGELRTADAVAR